VPLASGALWVTGSGDSRFFAAAGNGAFTSPADDFGNLVQNANGTYSYTARDQTQYNFSSAGLRSSVVYPDGLAWNYSYDSQGRLSQVTAPDGGLTPFAYGSDGFLASITEPGGRTVEATHDSAGNLIGLSDVDGSTRSFAYDSSHRVTSDQWAPWNTSFTYASGTGLLNGVGLPLWER
jgi:YD repeat-containing protein